MRYHRNWRDTEEEAVYAWVPWAIIAFVVIAVLVFK